MSSANRRAILFLGSGATAGSGITAEGGHALPSDGCFFDSPRVKGCLHEGFPALGLARSLPSLKCASSLYQTWNDLFVYRALARAGIVRESQEIIDEFNGLANFPWPHECPEYAGQAEHYRHQFQILGGESREYHLAELGIWDLRVLVTKVYGKVDHIAGHGYPGLWGRLTTANVSTVSVVNLNYDTTFDDTFGGGFYSPGDGTPADATRWRLIRPHGSLRWTSRGQWSIPRGNWLGWTESQEHPLLQELGYRNSPEDPTILDYVQPLIVPPAPFKEEVVGNSSMPGLQSPILRQQWTALEQELRTSTCWIFVGLSLASGDEHLLFLLKRALCQKKGDVEVHCSCYGGHMCLDLPQRLGAPIAVCCHPIEENQKIDGFLRRGPGSLTPAPCSLGQAGSP